MMMTSRITVFRGLLAIGLGVALLGIPVVASGDLISTRGDYTQYLARHHHLRTAILEHGVFAQRSHLLGGGYPILGDPEDPSFQPLSLLTIAFGEVMGLKLIGLLHMFVFGGGLFLLCLRRFQMAPAASLLAGLAAAFSLWIPVRMLDGNPNETMPAYLPLIFYAATGVGRGGLRILGLALLFGALLSDGKLSFVTSVLVLLLVTSLHVLWPVPSLSGSGASESRFLPLVRLGVALACAFCLFQFRIQPALEVISAQGGLGRMKLWFHADHYAEDTINAYTFGRMFWEANGLRGAWLGSLTSICVGPGVLLLAALGVFVAGRRALPYTLVALLCSWLMLAHQAPVDLFRPLWDLPVLSAIDAPGKYFSFFPVLVLCLLAGFGFHGVLSRVTASYRPLLILGVGLLALALPFVHSYRTHERSYSYRVEEQHPLRPTGFLAVRSDGLPRGRFLPANSNTYLNLRRGVGTLDWYSGIPLWEIAETAVVVLEDGRERANPNYRGEAFWLLGEPAELRVAYDYHHIRVEGLGSRGGILQINQNHHDDWKAPHGVDVISRPGELLRLQIPAGLREVVLSYSSSSLRLGAWLSLGSFLGILLFIAMMRRARSHSWQRAGGARRVFALGSEWLLK